MMRELNDPVNDRISDPAQRLRISFPRLGRVDAHNLHRDGDVGHAFAQRNLHAHHEIRQWGSPAGDPIWMTFRQASELKAHVRKGEKGSLVVYANSITCTEEDDDGEEAEHEIHYMKGYTVFNVEQIDGLPEHCYGKPDAQLSTVERISHAEAFFRATNADIRYRGDRAYYSYDGDYIQMPVIEAFRDAESFYATLAHESTHWTRHPSRLDRSFARKAWGDAGYAREELVAELASAFLSADPGITPEVRDDHAAYIASWLTVLKNDRRAIFSAAAHAQKAADYFHGLNTITEVRVA
jgi:antirestriction protein ArdC